jgi:hypothetical protein
LSRRCSTGIDSSRYAVGYLHRRPNAERGSWSLTVADQRYDPAMDQETRRNKIRDLIKAGTLPSYPSPADAVSGTAPCTACGTSGGTMKFQRLSASLCHECAETWRDLVKR